MPVNKTFWRKAVLTGAHVSGLAYALSPLLSGHGTILMLHRVSKQPPRPSINSGLTVTAEFLDRLLEELKRSSVSIISMDELADRLKYGRFCNRFAAITLDDGFCDNVDNGLPVFEAHDAPFTVYVATGFASRFAHLWWEDLGDVIDQRDRIQILTDDGPVEFDCRTGAEKAATFAKIYAYLTTHLVEPAARQFVDDLAGSYGINPAQRVASQTLDWQCIQALSRHRLATIGAHTVNHYHLARLDEESARFEIAQSKRVIEMEIGQTVNHLAYPYGSKLAAGPREARLAAEAGFETAVTTRHGLIRSRHCSHRFALPRISVNGDFQRLHFTKALMRGIAVPLANGGRRFVTM